MPGENIARERIAVVIPSFNRRDALEKCIESLLAQTRPLDVILIIDNASTDGTYEMVSRKFSRRAEVVRLSVNTGSAGGFHEGIRLAYDRGYDWIWCMDNDAEPTNDCLEVLIESLAFRDPVVGAVAPLLVDQDSKIQAMHHKRAVIPFERGVEKEVVGLGSEISLVANGWAGVLICRRAIHAAGLPRKELFVFCDDMEYTYRISRRFRVLLIPCSRVVHKSDSRWVKKAFGGRAESVRWPTDQLWRLYYDVRNRIFFVSRNAKAWMMPFILPLILARKVAGIVLFDEDKLRRLGVLLCAAWDGAFGRLGEMPDLPRWLREARF
jgi:rhamnopyranosyl-N-acetylglucosaminyl-diphospho-decaprenol beta-1,3/1,4-galactofuranosyltransferase